MYLFCRQIYRFDSISSFQAIIIELDMICGIKVRYNKQGRHSWGAQGAQAPPIFITCWKNDAFQALQNFFVKKNF